MLILVVQWLYMMIHIYDFEITFALEYEKCQVRGSFVRIQKLIGLLLSVREREQEEEHRTGPTMTMTRQPWLH
jgi:hypothetical protein